MPAHGYVSDRQPPTWFPSGRAGARPASCCWLTRTGSMPRRLLPRPPRDVGMRTVTA